MLPSGKGIYMRMDSMYPGDPCDYVKSIGCTFAAVLPSDVERIPKLRRLGVDPWLWSGPSDWQPSNAVASAERMTALARQAGCVGVIADPEGPTWGSSPDAASRMAQALDDGADGLGIIVTSFPNLIGRVGREWASKGAALSTQIYDVRGGLDHLGAALRNRYIREAADIAPAGPSVGAWGRNPEEQRAYFESLTKPLRFAILWHAELPEIGGPRHAVLKGWEPGYPKALKIAALVAALLVVGLAVYLAVRS